MVTTTSTVISVLIQGVELETVSIPLHKIILKCDTVFDPVTVGVLHSLPIKGVDLILGNDLAGGKVATQDYMTHKVIVYPACAVTRATAK